MSMVKPSEKTKLTGFLANGLPSIALSIGVVGLLGGVLAYSQSPKQFFFSYLMAYMFLITITWGSLFFVILQRLVRSGWSSTIRRIPETLMTNIPLMAVFFIPILFGMHELYHWTHA